MNKIKTPKIVFFGTPEFAVMVLNKLKNAGLTPILIITRQDAKKGRGLKFSPSPVKLWAEKNNVEFWKPENLKNEKFLEKLRSLKAELFIIASYGKILPAALLNVPPSGAVNVHPSLLPKYRGPSPMENAILDGAEKTGVTIMLVDEETDHGPILAQQELEFSISGFQFSKLETVLAELGSNLLIETIPKWLNNKIKPKEQNHAEATYTQKIKKEDGQIDWNKSAEAIERKVRALNPRPGTFTFWKKKGRLTRLIIIEAKTIENKNNKKAGEVFEKDGEFAVAAGKDALLIKRLKPEGKKEIASRDFLRGERQILNSQL
ncbi:MAG: methionyl-tRNA formyltransferase [Patescibacteria group bacterium]